MVGEGDATNRTRWAPSSNALVLVEILRRCKLRSGLAPHPVYVLPPRRLWQQQASTLAKKRNHAAGAHSSEALNTTKTMSVWSGPGHDEPLVREAEPSHGAWSQGANRAKATEVHGQMQIWLGPSCGPAPMTAESKTPNQTSSACSGRENLGRFAMSNLRKSADT